MMSIVVNLPDKPQWLAVQRTDDPGSLPTSLQETEAPVPAGHHYPVLHVVQTRHAQEDGGRRQGEAVHDGEGLGVEDVDTAALSPQHQAGDTSLLRVALNTIHKS